MNSDIEHAFCMAEHAIEDTLKHILKIMEYAPRDSDLYTDLQQEVNELEGVQSNLSNLEASEEWDRLPQDGAEQGITNDE